MDFFVQGEGNVVYESSERVRPGRGTLLRGDEDQAATPGARLRCKVDNMICALSCLFSTRWFCLI